MESKFKSYIKKILLEVSEEVNNDENMILIRNDILKPIIAQVLDELNPFFIKLIVIIISIIVFLLITIILNIRVIMYSH
jgi:hypothetical protein